MALKQRFAGLVVLFLVLVGLTIALNQFVTTQYPFGVDFYVYWHNARLLFIEDQSPFTDEAALQTQLALYGRPAFSHEDQKGFVYLPYSLFLIWPTIWIPFSLALAFWFAFNWLLAIGAAKFAFPDLPLWIVMTIPLFYPIARGLVMGQFSVLLGSLLLVVYGVLNPQRTPQKVEQWFVGFLLTLLTIKPQLTWLLVIYFLFYAFKTKCYGILISFFVGVGILSVMSWSLIPAWPSQLIRQIIHGSDEYQTPHLLPQIYAGWFVSDWGAILASAFIIILLVVGTILVFKLSWNNDLNLFTALAWCALVIQLVHPLNVPSEQVVLLLPILVGIRLRLNIHLTWSVVVAVPYLIFIFSQDVNLEPMALTTLPPLFFLMWMIWLTVQLPRDVV
ncbi:MAG: glycosyltransferase 87 family protein [Chloroflexota bacterium]